MQNNLLQLTGVDLVVPTHGIDGARSYPMGPNCRVPLFDDSEDILYIKKTDANGFPNIRKFKLLEIVDIEEDTNKGIVLDDIRNMIREEISAAVKEMNTNGQQSVSPANSESTNRNDTGIASVNKHNGKSYNAGNTKQPKQQGSNSSVMEHGKDQQQPSASI